MIYTFQDFIFCPHCLEAGKTVNLQDYYHKVDEKVMFKRCKECLEIYVCKRRGFYLPGDSSVREI